MSEVPSSVFIKKGDINTMRPPKLEYEKVPTGIPVNGIIHEVQYDEKRNWKGYTNPETGVVGKDNIFPGVRFAFDLDGCTYKHFSRWMKFNVGSQSNLYTKYLMNLIENAVPDMDFDLDELKGMRVTTVWADDGEYQKLESIVANGPKITVDITEAEIDDGKDKSGQILPF
jgi:signal peptidase I